MLKPIFRRVVPLSIRRLLHKKHEEPDYLQSYSQEGEDMVMRRFFEARTTPGVFVDVGAHHPVRYSNTYFFYRMGWRGINIDAMPGSMVAFNALRPRDVNVEAAISLESQILTYSIFNAPALNSFDNTLSAERDGKHGYHIVDRVKIQTRTLAEILDQNLSASTEIDFLTVDVEGLDLQVLKSNNWSKYRPTLVLAEDTGAVAGWEHIADSAVTKFLIDQAYRPFASTGYTVLYKKHD